MQHRLSFPADGDPGLAAAALLGGNIESARNWVAEVLGDLAANTDNDARLRDTLRVFLSCDSSYKHAADVLTLHSTQSNTERGAP